MELFKMFGRILIDDTEANKSISRTDKNTKSLGDRLRSGIKTAAKWGAALAAGAAVAIGGMIKLGTKVGNLADEILDLRATTGMSTNAIQEWRKVTELAGASTDAIVNGAETLNKRLDTMASETNKGNKAMRALGLSFDDISNMNADERMDALTTALSGVEDRTERARLGADIFGGAWSEVGKVVDLTKEQMEDAKGSANIISEEDLEKANEFRIRIDNMKERLSFFVTEIGLKVLPILKVLFDWFEEQMPKIQNFGEKAFNVIEKAMGKVSGFLQSEVIPRFNDLWEWIEPHLPKAGEFFMSSFGIMKDVLNGVVEAIQATTEWMKDHWNIVEPILIGIAAGIVTFQLITGAIAAYGAITKAITAIQLLFNGALAANPIGLVVVAIGLLVAAGVMLWKNWDVVTEKLGIFWENIKNIFGNIKDFVMGVFADMANGVKGFVNRIISTMNGLIRGLNRISFSVPDWVPVIGGKGWGFNLSNIPMLAKGGDIQQRGTVLVGEQGPELLDLPRGARVTPLDHSSVAARSGVTIERGAFDGAIVFDDYGVDRLMDRVIERLEGLGVK